MPRQRIDMTPDEVDAFLAAKHVAIVGTIATDGAPDGEPAAFSWVVRQALFVVALGGPTHRNLLHDPRVVCSVEEFPSYAGIKGVTVHGTAALVTERGGRATFHVDAARVESFDFAKMRR
jgi:nitroimidazol reductase NimA-like FMN-containing flavoprotein (pyridoxamine 5'-phosphate oxidase superfamily)